MTGTGPLAAALALALASALALLAPPRWQRSVAGVATLAAGALTLGVVAATRRAWELDVRRPVWLADPSRGRWLERGSDWLVAGALLAAAGALGSLAGGGLRPAATASWRASLALGAAAAAALGWGLLGPR